MAQMQMRVSAIFEDLRTGLQDAVSVFRSELNVPDRSHKIEDRNRGEAGRAIPSAGRHNHVKLLALPNDAYIAAIATLGISAHLILRLAGRPESLSQALLILVLGLGGSPLLWRLGRRLAAFEFGSDLLAGVAIVASALSGEYLVGSIIVLMLSGGAALEQYATRRASSVLEALAHRVPQAAHRRTHDGFADISLEDVRVGDALVVLPHEICPADGVVVDGRGSMDESYLTGEPFEIGKAPGSEVISGAINGEVALVVTVSRLPVDSRYARIVQVMRASEEKRPQLRRIGDRLGAWYTPMALALGAAGWWWSGDPDRFLAVIVIATPCPLLIAIPVAVIGAISISARRGIIIKNPAVLEQLDRCRTFIFDKTGTLTYGRPVLTDVVCAPGFSRLEVLTAAASLERYSKHPLAQAVLSAAQKAGAVLQPVAFISEKAGEGLRGMVEERTIQIAGRAKMDGKKMETSTVPGLECVVIIDGVFAAAFHFHDAPRAEGRPFIRHLKPSHQVERVVLLSGDREAEVRYMAGLIGITETHAGKSPEEKVAIVERETRSAKTLYVGDGINDAPAMLAATVGIALGQTSDITAEAAGAVVLDSSLAKVDELIHIGRRMRRIALQSAVGGILLSFVGMVAAIAGYLPPLAGAIGQEIIDLAAVLNAVRVALPSKKLTDF
jgi:heavy metal translocating P-type ATPase